MMYYIRLFTRTLYISVIVAIIVTISYFIYDYHYGKDIYSSSAGIFVNEDVHSPYIARGEDKAPSAITDINFAKYLLNVAIHYINTTEYQEIVIEKLKDTIPDIVDYDFENKVEISTYAGSNVVTVTAHYNDNADYPALIANALAETFKEVNAKKFGADYFTIISKAARNTKPVNMSLTMGCIVYGVGSLLLTYVLILFIDSLARSEGTYLSWRLVKKRKKYVDEMKEVYQEVG